MKENIKLLTTEQLWKSLEEAKDNRLPKTAKPFIEELRVRLTEAKDTKEYLRLRETERVVRNQSYGEYDDKEYTVDEWRDLQLREARSLWTPVREVLLANMYNKEQGDITLQEILVDHEDELTVEKQSSVFCEQEQCIPSASLYDAIIISLLTSEDELDSVVVDLWQKHIAKTSDDISANLLSIRKMQVSSSSDEFSLVAEMEQRSKSKTARLLADFAHGIAILNKAVDMKCETLEQMAEVKSLVLDAVSYLKRVSESKSEVGEFSSKAENLISTATGHQLNLSVSNDGSIVDPRAKSVPVRFQYKNVDNVNVYLYPAEAVDSEEKLISKRESAIKKWTNIRMSEIGNPLHELSQSEILSLDEELPVGHYLLAAFEGDKLLSGDRLICTKLSVSSYSAGKNTWLLVADAKYGSPKVGAKLLSTSTDANGMVNIKQTRWQRTAIDDGTESLQWNVGGNGYADHKPDKNNYINIVTDRTIYRPGQTIYFKAWSHSAQNGNMAANVGKKMKVSLETGDDRRIDIGTLTTNAWGTASGEYTIPEDVYCGYAYLIIDNEVWHYIQIDEYKRTNLTISFAPVEGIVKKGGKVTLHGTASQANGNPVANANVEWYMDNDNSISVRVVTDAEGKFSIDLDITDYGFYRVVAKLTDQKGETCEESAVVVCNEKGSAMSNFIINRQVVQGDLLNWQVSLHNFNGADWTSDVTCSLYSLKPLGSKWAVDRCIFEQKESVNGNKKFSCPTEDLSAGRYKLKFSTTLANDELYEEESTIFILPRHDEKVPSGPDIWCDVKDLASLGESVNMRVCTGLKSATAYCLIFADCKLISVKHIPFSSEVKTLQLQMPEVMPLEGKVQIELLVIGEGMLKKKDLVIALKENKPTLNILLKTSRDVSTPKAHEKWTLLLSDSTTNVPASEVVASMYDARLDKLSMGNSLWESFAFEQNLYTPYVSSHIHTPVSYSGYWYHGDYVSYMGSYLLRISSSLFPTLKEWSFDYVHNYRRVGNMLKSMVFGAQAVTKLSVVADEEQCDEGIVMESEMMPVIRQELLAPMPPPAPEPIDTPRDNFQETVFFYPHLITDKDGQVEFEFDLPDNLTTYKFQALAHTKDMRMAYITHNLLVRKELSVTMGAPRFVVEGDVVTLTALVECYDKSLSIVDCHLTVKDADGKEYISESQQVSLNGSTSAQAAWQIAVPKGVDKLSMAVSAKGNSHQDTEITTMQVTKRSVETHESLPFVVVGKNYKNDYKDDAERLERQQKYGNDNLTFKYNSNAFVEVVDALPYLDEEWSKSADTYLGRVESSAIALLIKSRPDVQKAVCGAYKLPRLDNEGYDTPWHSSAVHLNKHTADIHRVLSGNEAERTLKLSLRKLHELQKADGSIAWFPGMEGSDYMTVAVAEMLGRMIQMGLIAGNEEHVSGLCNGAKRYMDKLISKEAGYIRKHESDYVGSWIVELLYARALMPGALSADAEYIIESLKKNAQKDKSESYRIAVATLYNQIGAKTECELIVRSLIENLQHVKPGLASVYVHRFFYPTHAELYSQSLLTILLGRMDAMGWNAQNDNLVEVRNQLLNWLVFQKRSAYWRDRQSTAIAVLAVMGANADMTSTDEVQVGADSYTCTIEEPQLFMPRKSIEPVKVSKSQEYPSWGAWQWTETTPQDELVATGCDELKVGRTIFVQRNGKFEKLNGELKVGDVVKVELTLRATVDMSFVHLRDHKAASFEHADQTSNYVYPLWWWRADRSVVPHYYQPHDTHIDFFIEHLAKGESKLSYEATVTNAGDLSAGFAEVQCVFTPELVAKSAGSRIVISNINK
ncbi:MAG: MG2 domain-containing protein [Bacteroidales bacterium]|nr:MG2 domain-containing protein [Bacteroidales bacterium]